MQRNFPRRRIRLALYAAVAATVAIAAAQTDRSPLRQPGPPPEPRPTESISTTPETVGEWIESPRAAEIAERMTTGDEPTRQALAELVLSGELDLPLPELKDHYEKALGDPDPERRIRAISRLCAREGGIARRLLEIVLEPTRPDVRYEAFRALVFADREGLVPAQVRADLYRSYEASPSLAD